MQLLWSWSQKHPCTFEEAESPRIVIISSDLGSIGNTLDPEYRLYSYGPRCLPMTAAKAAVDMIGAVHAVQYKEEGFHVNMVNLGFPKMNTNNYADGAGK